MFSFFDTRTLTLVNIPMSLAFSLLILLIKFHFPRQFKGTTLWFLALLLPAVSFSLGFSHSPDLPMGTHTGTRPLPYMDTLGIRFMGISYIMGNLFLRMGWRRFYEEKIKTAFNTSIFFLSLFLPLLLVKFRIHPIIVFDTFNFSIFFMILMFLSLKYRKSHRYASRSIIFVNFLALLTTAIPLFFNLLNRHHLTPEITLITSSISYMFRNTLVLFSIYMAVMHQFKVNQNAIVEEKDQLMKELEVLSVTDALTGLYNRRGFDNFLAYEFKQIKREENVFTITLGDIDFFKKVNDSYGHDCGDYVIKCISQKIQNNLREQDCLARWGGEEFIILQKNSLETSHKVINRIRKEIEEMKISYNNHTFSITMSFGIAQMSKNNTHYDKVIINADTMLYKAKESGRNKVVY